jgi:Spx/MgsR family transcriptional regulator
VTSVAYGTTVVYGIRNCDTVTKARRWLDGQGIAYRFHDFRRDGLELARVERWLVELGWEQLINRRGITWRQLDANIRDRAATTAPELLRVKGQLGADGSSVARTERDLKQLFPQESWRDLHLQIIYYGREHCSARGCDGTRCDICRTCYPRRKRPLVTRKA